MEIEEGMKIVVRDKRKESLLAGGSPEQPITDEYEGGEYEGGEITVNTEIRDNLEYIGTQLNSLVELYQKVHAEEIRRFEEKRRMEIWKERRK